MSEGAIVQIIVALVSGGFIHGLIRARQDSNKDKRDSDEATVRTAKMSLEISERVLTIVRGQLEEEREEARLEAEACREKLAALSKTVAEVRAAQDRCEERFDRAIEMLGANNIEFRLDEI